jgi:hypothetical protein
LNKAKYYQPTEYFSDSEAGEIDYLKDYHTPTGLVDHKYIWQTEQYETAKLNEGTFSILETGPAIANSTALKLVHNKATTHNVQPKVTAIYEQRFGTLVQGNTNYLIFKKILPAQEQCSTYFMETTFIHFCGSHPAVQPYRIGLYIVNNFNQETYNLKHRIEIDIYITWHISMVRYDSYYTPSPL